MVNFKQLLERATNSDLSEPDWETILEIVEEVKTKNVSAKNAIKEFRKRLLDGSGNTVYLTLLVLDSLMKNCASDVHSEVLSVEFMGIVKTVITSSKDGKSEKAIDKALELIGEWKAAFGDQTGYKAVNSTFSELEREGYHIPMAEVASAAFIKKAPEWVLGERCFMCRQEFNRFKGKLRHHCRNCGKSVCAPCSGKRAALPHFGVEEPTRVCDICYKKVEKGEGASASAAAAEMDSDLPPEYLHSSLAQESQGPSSSSSASPGAGPGTGPEQQVREDDDLQLAIAMSLNEQENKAKKTSPAPTVRFAPSPASTPRSVTPSAPPPSSSTLYANIAHDHSTEPTSSYSYQPPAAPQSQPTSEPSSDPLARYLDRSYWEQRREQQESSMAPPQDMPTATPTVASQQQPPVLAQAAAAGASGSPLAESIRNSIAMFVKRLHEVNSSGTSIATDPVVLSLYQNLTAMQPQLLKQIDDIQQQKAKQLNIINKLNEAKEARVTLNKMRRDHQDKVKQMEQEQAILARMQMEQKLALLRQQKQEQLVFQQSLQHKRLEVLNTQRVEYEQKISMQRELERQQLIAQEKKVLQHQFGPAGGPQQQAFGGAGGQQVGSQQQQQQQQPYGVAEGQQVGGQQKQQQAYGSQQQQQPFGGPGGQQQQPFGGSGGQQQQPFGGQQQQAYGGPGQAYGGPGGQQQQPFGGPRGQPQPFGGQFGATGGQQQYGGSPNSMRKTQPAQTQQYTLSTGVDVPPPSLSRLDPASLSLHSMSLHDPNQALPLPSKVEYNPTPTVDPLAPPPYNPTALGPPESQTGNVYASYQAPPTQQSYQPPPLQPPTTYQAPSLQQPPASYQAPPTQQPVSYQAPSPQQTFQGQPPGTLYQPTPPQQQTGTYYQEPGSLQPSQMTSLQQQQQPASLGGMQLPQSGYGSSSSLPSQSSVAPSQPGSIANYSPLTTGGAEQYQEPPPPPQVPPAGYQVYQSQFPEQQTAGTFVPNGAHPGVPLARKESEPPLISFD